MVDRMVHRKYISLIHNNMITSEHLTRILTSAGFLVDRYPDVISALDAFQESSPPDMIITAIHLPGIDGWRLCRLLRSREFSNLNKVPVMVVTETFTGEENHLISLELGANDFLTLPVDPDEFLSKVGELLDEKATSFKSRVLLVEDNPRTLAELRRRFVESGYLVETAVTISEAMEYLDRFTPHVVVLADILPDGPCDIILHQVCLKLPESVAIVIAEEPNQALAIQWMKDGATAYAVKPVDSKILVDLCNKARREKSLLRVGHRMEAKSGELKANQELLRTVFESSPDMIYLKNTDLVYIEVNPAGTIILSLPRTSIVGMTDLELFGEEVFRQSAPSDREVLSGKVIEDFPKKTVNGEMRRFHVLKIPMRDQAGDIYALCGIERDITDQTQRDDDLRLRTLLFDQIQDHVTITDLNGIITYINHSQEKTLGMPRERVIGCSTSIFGEDPRHGATQKQILENTLKNGSWRGEVVNYSFDGKEKILDCQTFIIKDDNGNPLALCGIASDITDRKQLETSLFENQRFINDLFDNSGALIFLKDHKGIYQSVNRKWEEVTGCRKEEVIGKSDRDIFHETDSSSFIENDRRVMDSGQPIEVEEVLHLSGETRYFLSIKFPRRDANGTIVGICGVTSDITDRKRAEEALEKRLISLTRPLIDATDLSFEDLFNLQDIQRLQDEFAKATGVASIITHPDGTPITSPSAFCRLCQGIIRKTKKGRANCFRSDAVLGRVNFDGPIVQPCMSGGLWDAGAAITVGDKHIANWLIGQVRDETQTEEAIRNYARLIGSDENDTVKAFHEVPAMSRERFGDIAQVLFTMAKQLSLMAFQNVQQARFITDLKRSENQLAEQADFNRRILNSSDSSIVIVDPEGIIIGTNDAWENIMTTMEQMGGKTLRRGDHFFDPSLPESVGIKSIQAIHEGVRSVQNGRASVFVHEFQCQFSAKETEWFQMRALPLVGKYGTVFIAYNNISERKKAEEALRVSEERMRLALKATNDVVWDWDIQRNEHRWNETGATLFGWNDNIANPHSIQWWKERVHPEDLPRVDSSFGDTIASQVALHWHEDYRFLKADRTWAQIMDRAYVIRDSEGKAVRLIGAMTDITERVRADREIRFQAGLIASLLDSIPDLVFYKNTDLIYLGCNPAFARHVGLIKSDVSGKSDFDLYSVEDAHICQKTDRETLEKDAPVQYEEWVTYPDGSKILVETMKTPYHDADGQLIGVLGISRDITLRKDQEEALRVSEERFRSISENAFDLISVIDGRGVYHYCNQAYLSILGYEPKELIGKFCQDLVYPEDQSFIRSCFEEYHRTGLPLNQFTLRLTHRDGSPRWVDHRVRPLIGTQWEGSRILISAQDITRKILADQEREIMQGQLLQSQKMESVGRLAGGVAHDFNNLLTIILGYSAMTMANITVDHPLFDNIDQIMKAAERAGNLTRQLLAFARKQTLQVRTLDMNEVIVDFEKMLSRVLRENIRIEAKPAQRPCLFRGDLSQVEQVILNLAVNAQDAMPEGGLLEISTDFATIDKNSIRNNEEIFSGSYCLLKVSDTGFGMSPEVRDRIFEPFFTTKELGRGTGLGLSTVFGIVKQHNGFVEVNTELGQGTCFSVYFPLQSTDGETSGKLVKHDKAKVGRETILVVEDNPAVLEMTGRFLRNAGYATLTAPGGKTALSLIDNHAGEVHLLLTDVIMPDINGRQLYDRIAEKRPGIRVLFMSGYTAEILSPHGVLKNVHYIQKPFTMDTLIKKVRETLDIAKP